MHLHLREQQVRYGDVGGESFSQHRLLQERRLHTRTQSETQTLQTENCRKTYETLFRQPYVCQLLKLNALSVVMKQLFCIGVFGGSCSVSDGRTLQLACVALDYNRRRLTVHPGSCRCEHAYSCLMLMYDTAHKRLIILLPIVTIMISY